MGEVAQRLGIGRTTCYAWAKRGRLPVIRREGSMYVPRHALEALIATDAREAVDNLADPEEADAAEARR